MANLKAQENNAELLLENPVNEEIDLIELFYRLLEKFKIILVAGVIGALVMGVYSQFFATPLYRATSQMYILSSRDSAINLSDLQIGATLTKDYEEVLYIWEVEALVRQNLGLNYNNSQLRSMISVSNPASTRILKITVTSKNAQEAADIANEYVNVAREYISNVMQTDAPSVLSEAQVPRAPFSPRKARNVALGFVAGVALAVIIITILFVLDDKIKTGEDIRKYAGLATLAVVVKDNGQKAYAEKGRKKER